MAARLTDRQKKKIIADYVELESYNAVAKRNGVSKDTVKRVVLDCEEIAQMTQQKKEENTADIMAYMESQKQTICEIIGKGLSVLNDPEKLKEATPSQITTAIGTLIDKWTNTSGTSSGEQTQSHNALIEAIRKRSHED